MTPGALPCRSGKVELVAPQRVAHTREVELVALRRVAPRAAAQLFPGGRAAHTARSAAERASAAEATNPMTDATGTLIEELFGPQAASVPRRRGGVVAARQPLPRNSAA
jgi:hypothetical protein